ncbi:acc operon protein [Salinirubellus sp. GCM10025818]|uniref:acc operon protein n=1 Tax=Salinirubellus TaxID=2162630 RepID=UPI0030D517D4
MEIELPEDADEDEAAAIVAALNAHVSAQLLAVADEEDGDDWNERQWSFAGRIGDLQHREVRVPLAAPRDPWTASGRARRMR